MLMCIFSVTDALGQAKDVFDSFDNFGAIKVGVIVVGDTTNAPTDAYGLHWYNYFKYLGFNVIKVDTNYCDQATYDGSNNWNTLDLAVFLPTADYTTMVGIDTSVANGIGEIPVIDMHQSATIADSLGLASAIESAALIDSIKFGSDSTAFQLNYITPSKARKLFSTSTIYGIDDDNAGTYATNNLLHAVSNGVDTMVIALYDTLNNQKRLYFSGEDIYPFQYNPYPASSAVYYWKFDGLTVLNKTISLMIGTNTDSLFYFAGLGGLEQSLLTDMEKNWLECNGHRVELSDCSNSAIGIDGDYGDSLTYDGTVGWGTPEAVFFGSASLTGGTINFANLDSLVTHGVAIGHQPKYFVGGTQSDLTGATDDTLIAVATGHRIITGGAGINDTLEISSLAPGDEDIGYFSDASDLTTIYDYYTEGTPTTGPGVVEQKGTKKIGIIYYGNSQTVGKYYSQYKTSDFWDLLANAFGYIFSAGVDGFPITFALTAINTDSIAATWTDGATNETAYGVYIYEPTNAAGNGYWFTTGLAAGVESDTLNPFWPPNSRVIADCAAIAANDTVFSGSPDTAYTNAAVPPPPTVEALSDSQLIYTVNGYSFADAFRDSGVLNVPVPWTQTVGTWDVEWPNRLLEVESAGGDIVVPYSTDNLTQDVEFRLSYAFSDSTLFTSQSMNFWVASNTQDFNDDGYYVYCDDDEVTFRRMDNGTDTDLITATISGDNSHWHNLKVTRDWHETPNDTECTWTLYWNGISKGTATDKTYTAWDYMGVETSTVGQHADNFFIRGMTPSANHYLTKYAIYDSVNTKYLDLTTRPGKLTSATALWYLFSTLDSVLGDTLSGLAEFTLFYIQSKAKSGWE